MQEESKAGSGSESGDENKECSKQQGSENGEGDDEKDGGEVEVDAEQGGAAQEEGDEEREEKKKRKEKKSYDYATKLNYLFRETRWSSTKPSNWSLRTTLFAGSSW